MLFDERNYNAYSERLVNQVQMKLDNLPFKPHNFKLSYDLDAYENEKTQKFHNNVNPTNTPNCNKANTRTFAENENSRMFFEAMKLKTMRKHAQKLRETNNNNNNNINNNNNSKQWTPPVQTSGKFYHLNFEPMRIEDYRDIDEGKINEDEVEIMNKLKNDKNIYNQEFLMHNKHQFKCSPPKNDSYNLDSKNNNIVTNNNNNLYTNNDKNIQINNQNYNKALDMSYNNNNSKENKSNQQNQTNIQKSPIIMKSAEPNSEKKPHWVKENTAKVSKGSQRKLPSIPIQQANMSRLSSIMPDLIATTKAPSIAEEIMAVFNREKHSMKKEFKFPVCCSPEEVFGLEKIPIYPENVRPTIDDLGYPETIDPIKKYSDLYLNESYVRSIICFLSSIVEEVRKIRQDGENERSDGETSDERTEMKKEFNPNLNVTPDFITSAPDIELQINKTPPRLKTRQSSENESIFTPDSLSPIINENARPPSSKTPRDSRKSSKTSESGFDVGLKRDGSTSSRADCQSVLSNHSHNSDNSDCGSHNFPPGFTDIEFYLDESDATHRGCHKFLPRHPEEIQVEIGDGLYVEKEHDDLWCEGINIRTKKRGIFPTAYATDLSLIGDAPKIKYFVSFLGSIEIGHHNGHDILCKAIKKIISAKNKQNNVPANLSCLEIDENGIKVSERKKKTPTSRILSTLGKLSLLKNLQENEHVFLLKNITFCGILPSNDKYLGFITKHPVCMKFACHVFLASNSARPIVEAIGNSLSKFHQEFLSVAYPVEDIYFE